MAGMLRTTKTVWAGRVISALVALFLIGDGAVSVFASAKVQPEMIATGFPLELGLGIGLIAIVSGVIYAIPRTAVLGAILVTGFLGGAICTHYRIGEIGSPPQIICLIVGALAWGGLYLRDTRLRDLLPIVR